MQLETVTEVIYILTYRDQGGYECIAGIYQTESDANRSISSYDVFNRHKPTIEKKMFTMVSSEWYCTGRQLTKMPDFSYDTYYADILKYLQSIKSKQ